MRGVILPPGRTTKEGRLADESGFPGDVVIEKGVWQKGKSIFDVADGLAEGDMILKGANALGVEVKATVAVAPNPTGNPNRTAMAQG